MIVQKAHQDGPSKVILMRDHLDLASQFSRGFGNDHFASLNPADLMDYAIRNHDAGWDDVDENLGIDPETGLPKNLLKTPLEDLVKTGPASADINEAHHPFCGLLISMHAYGLLNGRYGLSDKIVVDVLPESAQPMFRAMLDGELDRQNRLKEQLRTDPRTCEWVEERMLFHNYKILQFFDTLCLYFSSDEALGRTEASFMNVPRSVGDDVTVTVSPIKPGVYRVEPFPFSSDPMTVKLPGTMVTPNGEARSAQEALQQGIADAETITLVS